MRLSPLDIQNHRFGSRLRGVDPNEVESFLQLVSEDYEALQRDRDALATRVESLEAQVEELRRNEKVLQETLVTAQTLSEDLKKNAVRESEVLVSQAEVKAEKVLETAHRRAARLADDIREMKALRKRLGVALRQTIETHLALVESLTMADEAEEEDAKIAYLAPPKSAQDES